MTGRQGIPTSGVSAVVFNLTAVSTTASGYFTAYPSDKTRPTASSVNFLRAGRAPTWSRCPWVPREDQAYNHSGTAHAIVDVLGW